jgi:cytochrome c oxidase subunit 2
MGDCPGGNGADTGSGGKCPSASGNQCCPGCGYGGSFRFHCQRGGRHARPGDRLCRADTGIGVPDGRKGIQDQVTELGQKAEAFHDNWLLLMCAVISIFVLGLLVWTIVRYRRGANPTPSRTTHNTAIEVVWTLVPVLILVAIAIPSIRLIRAQYSPPPADVTIKVIGNQWYWTYQYPDNGGIEIVSNMLKEQKDVKAGDRFRTDADGPPMLAADERLVIPAGKVVKFIVTSNDVIHAFAVPAFWTKIDANPGRLNETWVKVDRPGVYFGQCSELCGARHGFMPISVEGRSEATFNAWLASKGGTPEGRCPVGRGTGGDARCRSCRRGRCCSGRLGSPPPTRPLRPRTN